MTHLEIGRLSRNPQSFWPTTRGVLVTLLGFGIVLILAAATLSAVIQVLLAALLVSAFAFGLVARSEIALLCTVLAGFVVVVRYAEGFQLEEVVYGLVYVSYLVYWFVSRTFFYRDSYLRTPVDWAIFLFLIYMTASLALTPLLGGEIKMAVSNWSSLSMLAFYFPIKEVCIRYQNRRPQRAILFVLGGIALFVAVRNLLDYRRGLAEAEYLWQIATGRVVMNEHVLLMAALISIVFLLYASNWRQRVGLGFISSIYTIGVIIGQSRAVWVSFLLGLGIVFLFVERKRQIQIALISLVGLIVLLVVGWLYFEESFRLIAVGLADRFFSLKDAAVKDVSLVNRFVEMGAVWEYIRVNPIIGHGLGQTYKYHSLVFDYTRVTSYVHNAYFGILYRHGLLGFAMLGTFYVGAVWYSFRVAREMADASPQRVLAVAALAFLIAEALVANAANPFTNADTTLIIASMAALSSASYHRLKVEGPE